MREVSSAPQWLAEELHHQRDHDDAEEGALAVAEGLGRPGEGEGALEVGGVDDRQHAGAEQDDLPVLAQHLGERQLHRALLRQHALHVFRLLQLQADHHADDDQHRREQERRAPAPENEVRGGQGAEGEERQGRQQVAGGRALLGEGGVQDAFALGRAFAGDQDRATPLAADRDALDDTQRHQGDRCPDADLRIDRQQADAGRGDAHHDQGDHQGGLAADAVAEMAEDDPAQRASDEARPEGDEGQQGGQARIHVGGEEYLAEHQGGGQAVDVEVVPLDGGADEGGDTGPAGLLVQVGVFGRGRARHGSSPVYCCSRRHAAPYRPSLKGGAETLVSVEGERASVLTRVPRSLGGTPANQ